MDNKKPEFLTFSNDHVRLEEEKITFYNGELSVQEFKRLIGDFSCYYNIPIKIGEQQEKP